MKKLSDLTPDDVMGLPPEVLALLLPPHLRERPTTGRGLAYWYLAAEKPDGHLPCPAGSGCTTCTDTYEAMLSRREVPLRMYRHPEAEVDAAVLLGAWYRAGAATVAWPDDDSSFDPELVP
ncbi:hypothetical protein [Blastococcus sp. TF02A-35]|uniref:hypothetical protein n=1 Tax=Blastococcus sp. TF02A-35 TaxID=2559612 RepID=UPI0010735E4C|nr:hypothetical protein [Blastococcus sp. TF02A_35]TFV44855.1 hypothetical protein E4P43_18320 [Blastococcus sp. TF02A_35]